MTKMELEMRINVLEKILRQLKEELQRYNQSETGINEYNKVSINNRYIRDYRDLKVRVIKPNGKIEELPKHTLQNHNPP